MGQGTSFDPDILEDACNDLTRIDTIIKASTSLSNMGDASTIAGDIGGLDDTNGGWGYVGGQVTDVAQSVSKYVSDLQQAAGQVHEAMQASIDTLKGADASSATTVNQSGYDGSQASGNPQGRG
jgi:hypothetical protein